MSWSPPASDGGSAITSYTVTPFVGSTAGTPVPVGASTTSTNVSGLTNGTTYTFQVTATNSVGTGPAGTSNAVTVGAPTPPTGVTAVAAANQATVSWTASSPNASAVTGYVLTASTSGLAQNAVGVSGTTTSNVVLTGLAGGTSYTFQVVASNSFGNSPPSAASAPVTPSGSTTTYASTVLGDGPVVYYRLGDPSGSVAADSSGSGRNGSYEGSVSLGSGSALVNDSNPSFSLGNGSDLRYRLATGLPTGNGARSVEAWINTTSTSAGQGLVGYGQNPSFSSRQTFQAQLVGNYQLSLVVGGDDKLFSAPYVIANGGWHHLVFTYDGTTLTAYLDGQSLGTATFAAALNTVADSNGLLLGQNFWCCGSGQYFGAMDEVAIYPTALTATQVAAHFNASGNSRPAAPTNVSATAGANQATVSWTASTTSAGAPVTGYLVTAYIGTQPQNSLGVSGTTTSVTLTGLRGATSYTFQVVASNNFGNSPPSAASLPATPTGSTTTYASTVLADGPVAYYRLGDPSGFLAADSSGSGRHGNYEGSYTLGTAGALVNDGDPSYTNGNGSDMRYRLATGLPTGNSARSVEAWIKTTSATAGQGLVGYGQNPSFSTRQTFQAQLVGNNQLSLVAGGNDKTFTASYVIANGGWHHVVFTYDGTTLTAYLDGQSLGTATFAAALNTVADSNGLLMGQNFWCCGSGQFIGAMDEVAIYPTALTATQVAAHFNASGNSRAGPPTTVKAIAGPQAVLLAWTAPANRGIPPLTGYQITPYIGSTAGTPFSVGPPLTAATMTWLNANTAYTFQVQSVNNFGFTAAVSNQITTTARLGQGNVFNSIEASVGYADCRSAATLPHPWQGDPNVNFIGGCLDSGAVRMYNLSTSAITVADVSVDVGTSHFDLWGTNLSLPAASSLILSQTANFNFDTSDAGGQGCTQSGIIPVVHITIGGVTHDYQDSGQVLVTGGIDLSTCKGQNETTPWQVIGGGPTTTEVWGPNGSEHICWACLGDPVNTASGGFSESFTDLQIPGRGVPLLFQRTYDSLASGYDGPLGFGWTGRYNMFLTVDGVTGNVFIHQEGGSLVTFTAVNGAYKAPPRVLAALTLRADGTFLFKRVDQRSFAFNARGELVQETDRNGYATSFGYTADQLTTVTDPAGRALTFTYSGARISSISDPINRSVSFIYDANGNLTSVTDVGGGVTTFTYDANHLMLTITDPNKGVTTNVYDAAGRVTSQTDAMSRVTTFSYSGDQTTITDPKMNVTVQQYSNNEMISETRGSGTLQAATWTYTYDQATLGLASVTDPNKHVTKSTYDASGNLLSRTDALNEATTYTYNPLNEILTATDPLTVTMTNTYDTNGNLTQVSRPLTGTTQKAITVYQYDPMKPGDVIQMTDPDGKVWKYAYDQFGNRVKLTDPLNDVTTYGFDTIGRMISKVSPKGNVSGGTPSAYTTTYTYNTFGDVLTLTDPLSHQTVNQYDGNRNLTKVTDANNHAMSFTYDKDNERTQVVRADTTTMTTDYNMDGTVLDQKDGKNNPILTYAYDALKHVTSTTDALGNVTSLTSDGVGNRLTKQDPGGNCSATPSTGCTTFTYDAVNQLKSITYSDGITPNVANLTYDSDGQRTGMTDGTGASAWVWDSLHRLTSYKNGAGAQVQYAYNLRNLVTTITYPGTLNVTRGYDDAGRLTSIQDWLSNTTSFGYDPNSNLTTETLPAGTGLVDTSGFDAADRLMSISDAKAASVLFSASYGRDSGNQLTADSSVPGAVGSYAYTTINQLCYAGSSNVNACSVPPLGATAYAYDAADNLTRMGSTQQAFNAADELCWTAPTAGTCASPPAGATTFAYDARGNRTLATPPTGGATSLSYDQANRLTAYGLTASYAYNGDGLRMSKTASATTRQFLWDVTGNLPQLIEDGSTAYVYGPGGMPLEQISGSAVLWLHQDQLGSTRLISDSTGTSQATYAYDAYGNLSASTGAITNPFRFAGQYQDSESGFYYLRARYYDPSTGQFISRDPMVALTREAYAYTGDNPLNGTDPTGLYDCGWQPWNCISIPTSVGQAWNQFTSNVTNPQTLVIAGAAGLTAGAGALCVVSGVCEAAAGALGIGGGSAALNEAEQAAPGEAACSQGQLNWAQNILNQGGQNALLKSQGSIQAQLAAHEAKLAQIQAAGGYTSSVEREISNFQGQLNAIQRLQNQ